jgi:hypothetical protein
LIILFRHSPQKVFRFCQGIGLQKKPLGKLANHIKSDDLRCALQSAPL